MIKLIKVEMLGMLMDGRRGRHGRHLIDKKDQRIVEDSMTNLVMMIMTPIVEENRQKQMKIIRIKFPLKNRYLGLKMVQNLIWMICMCHRLAK